VPFLDDRVLCDIARFIDGIRVCSSLSTMSEEEFCERFIERLKLHCRAGRNPFGKEPETYGEMVAPVYWHEMGQELGPEKCADQDADYWP